MDSVTAVSKNFSPRDREEMPALYDFLGAHWTHKRTINRQTEQSHRMTNH